MRTFLAEFHKFRSISTYQPFLAMMIISCHAIIAIDAPFIIVTMASMPSHRRSTPTGGDGGADLTCLRIKQHTHHVCKNSMTQLHLRRHCN